MLLSLSLSLSRSPSVVTAPASILMCSGGFRHRVGYPSAPLALLYPSIRLVPSITSSTCGSHGVLVCMVSLVASSACSDTPTRFPSSSVASPWCRVPLGWRSDVVVPPGRCPVPVVLMAHGEASWWWCSSVSSSPSPLSFCFSDGSHG